MKNLYLFILIFFLYNIIELNAITQDTLSINRIDENGDKQGEWIIKYKNNSIKEKGVYKNNKKKGLWISYFTNGNIKSKITYSNGIAKGYAEIYYPNGKIQEKGNWQINHWVGNYKYYYENGNTAYNWNYNNSGKREGEQEYFHKNGKKMYNGIWKNGKTSGNLNIYNKEGKLIKTKRFISGKLDAIIEKPETIKQNTVNSKSTKNNSLSVFTGNGEYTLRNTRGDILKNGLFKDGKLVNGKVYKYDKNYKLISVSIIEKGEIIKVEKK